jgi:predicted Fe-S protein YdhL (DUF1289 family)
VYHIEGTVNKRNDTLQSNVWKRWELYSDAQKEAILEEFRRRLPDDHFNKELLAEFLQEKYQQKQL